MFSQMQTPELVALLKEGDGKKINSRHRAIWGELYRRFPNRHDVAVSFALQLWGAEAVEPLAKLLPDVLQRFPESEVFSALWVECALTWGDPAETARRLEGELSRFPAKSSILFRACQVQLSLGNFSAAVRLAERGLATPGRAQFQFVLALARKYEEVKVKWAAQTAQRDYHIFCVGLDRQPRRFQRVQAQLQRMGERVHFVSGVDGVTLPEMASRTLTQGSSGRMKGTLGCFLSHVRVWEICVASDMPYAFVIEDDTRFVLPPPPSTASLETGGIDFDLCFVNEGAQNAVFIPENLSLDKSVPLERVLTHQVDSFRGVGTYGYFVSKQGARKLLDMVEEDGLVGDVDWRLMLYAASDDAVGAAAGEFMVQSLRVHLDHRKSKGQLKAIVAPPAIVKTYNGGSIRGEINDFSHAYEELVR